MDTYPADQFWLHAAEGTIPVAVPFTMGEEEGMVTYSLHATPSLHAALHSPDAAARTRAHVGAIIESVGKLAKQCPEIKVER